MTQQLERQANRIRVVDPNLTPPTGEGSPLRLTIAVVLIAALTVITRSAPVVLIFAAILTMIMLHEFGHFVTARWAGMRVTDFFVGFGPTIWSTKRGDTRWGVKALPIGGFVRVIGMNNLEEIAPEDEPYTYRSKTYFQRVRFAVAGTFTHFVVAFVLMVALLAGYGLVSSDRVSTELQAVAETFDEEGTPSPARAAGIRAGDQIVGINGTRITHWEQVSALISGSAGTPITVTVDRDGRRFSVPVTPVDARTDEDKANGVPRRGMIGISPAPLVEKKSLPAATWEAGFQLKALTFESVSALKGIFGAENVKHYGKQLTTTGPADPETDGNRFLSLIGLGRIANTVAEDGGDSVLRLLIGLNVFIGIFNMIPLLPFDGGHIAVATYEAVMSRIKGRRHMIDMNKMLPVAYAVVFALILIGVTAMWLDIVHPINI